MESTDNFKFQLYSDIHLEFFKSFPQIPPKADYLFLAGDIGKLSHQNFKPFFDYCSKNWKKTFYVFGNHEYYSSNKTHKKLNKEYNEFFDTYDNVHLLNDSFYDLDDTYQIYGSTLWSSIDLTNNLNDFKKIKMKNDKNWTVPINLEYYNNLYENSVNKLFDHIKTGKHNSRKLIILTHYPPLRKTDYQLNDTSHPKYNSENLSIKKYFANDFTNEYLIDYGMTETELYKDVVIWMSGHTHYSYDFNHCTRFLSNQFGYRDEISETGINMDGLFNL